MVTCVVIGRWATLVNHSDLAGWDWSWESRLKYRDPDSDNCIAGTGSNVMSNLSVHMAYIDPGSGSLLLQFLLAGVVGSAVFFRNQVAGLLSWIRHKVFTRKT